MDLKGLVNKARDTLRKNPNLIEKGGDAIDKATKNKYAGQVDKAQDAVRKAVGAQEQGAPRQTPPSNPGEPLPGQQSPQPRNPQNPQ
ncbi:MULTISPECIES: antitoxin [Gordonia]|uniref:Antitoxin n=1 Tax=Gordonia amicalis TaxID=89053 RepID=A0AAE4R689_9ACTN|nr:MULTISPECIES: antitoxin [Gordonia]ATD69923.1 antitoxin [Gordonia sp. 1D]MCR8897831.1 antitoxin [Gordonia sp. GONU]MCZ0911988.1 antitoxin [Gordonia amicalis]MDJ0453973.1 antitoxin [Gordonia amicalis]MDV6307009.1 antitoxin [Gordonia amicalis]